MPILYQKSACLYRYVVYNTGMTKTETRIIKIAGKSREVEITTDGSWFDIRVKVRKSRVLGTGKTLAEAIKDAEPTVADFDRYAV